MQEDGNFPAHGGDITAAEARFGIPAQGWLDLSTGINPHSYPTEVAAENWHRLPIATDEQKLIEAACQAYGVADAAQVVAAPGTQALIQWLPRLLPPEKVAVIGPTYGEHESAWRAWDHTVESCEESEVPPDSRVVILVNPNNPDGRILEPKGLIALAQSLAARKGLLIVDEAFADVTPEVSLAGRLVPGMVVLRSFGKFYGLAGLRLGFAIAEPPLARLLRQWMGPWAVSGPAMAIGAKALADGNWASAMRVQLAAEAEALDAVLQQAGLSVIGGTTLYRLVNAPRAWALYEHLAKQGILVRCFAHSPRWLRIGLPPSGQGLQRLAEALANWS